MPTPSPTSAAPISPTVGLAPISLAGVVLVGLTVVGPLTMVLAVCSSDVVAVD